MSEQHAHPVALRPGDKVLVEAKISNEKLTPTGNICIRASGKNDVAFVTFTDPATVHPASLLAELRAEVEAENLLSENRLRLAKEMHDERDSLRAKLAAAEAQRDSYRLDHDLLLSHHEKQFVKLQEVLGKDDAVVECAKRMCEERDTARRELAEALELLKPATVVANDEDEAYAWVLRKKAILARHSFVEKRKGERRKLEGDGLGDRRFYVDRRKASEPVKATEWVDPAYGPVGVLDSIYQLQREIDAIKDALKARA